jgi:hypothetical protein
LLHFWEVCFRNYQEEGVVIAEVGHVNAAECLQVAPHEVREAPDVC